MRGLFRPGPARSAQLHPTGRVGTKARDVSSVDPATRPPTPPPLKMGQTSGQTLLKNDAHRRREGLIAVSRVSGGLTLQTIVPTVCIIYRRCGTGVLTRRAKCRN